MKKKIEFASHPANLWLVRHCVRQFLQSHAFPSRAIDLMVLGIDEACTNIIRHAYHQAEDQLISLSLETTKDNGVRFRIRDYGDRFDATKPHGRSLDQVRPGGLGVHLIQHAFDQIDYQQRRRGTLLVLTKRMPDAAAVASPELAPNLAQK
jgi:anti-sigma regulatory factor (Ser/Thr protein kinase)